MKTNTIGIDPGVNGGLCLLGSGICELERMPATPGDLVDLLRSWRVRGECLAIMEKVSSSPQMGVKSAFTFGEGFGLLQGAMLALDIPCELVRPRAWMSGLNIRAKKKDETATQWKNHLKCTAQRMAPSRDFTLATCDAYLIAVYGRRNQVEA